MIKFLGERAQTAKWAINSGYLPVRASAKDEVVATYKANPAWGSTADAYTKLLDWTPYAMVESPVAGYESVRALIDQEVLTRVLADSEADPKELLDQAVTKANAILAEYAPK